ncbi:MAG: glucoamylase family protein [Candidatus Omnitrophota bacterium]|nr:glucoamylase family protein [Candidatus Omnitrophota bacterium]
MFNKIFTYMLIASAALALIYSPAAAADYDQFLERIERQAFDYFLNETDKTSGLTLNTTEPEAPATNAASGFTLSAMVIGAERGWIAKDRAYKMCLKVLNAFKKMENFEGFTYHYFNIDNGSRMWASEVSCIDTALLLAGAITAGEYFKGTEVSSLADEIFKKVNWEWFLNNDRALQMSWKPEKGFSGRIDSFSEGIICYILAMGSPTHPIPKECWDSFTRPVSQYGGYKLIYVADGSLFQYLFPLAWLDLRDKHDKYADYWQNAMKAAKANKKYCLDNSDAFATYREGFWGLSASLSPDGYRNFGARPGRNKHNGTVAPYAVAGSIPLVPKFAIANYESMYTRVSAAVKQYGLTDAFNIDRKWASEYYISIDQGLTLLMIENYRTGLIWKYFMQNDYVKKGLEAAGFVPGKQDEPSWLAASIGNPDDKVVVKKLTKKVTVDGSLSDWANSGGSKITLTAKHNRNIELTIGAVRDDSDLSAVFYLGHDSKNLYIAGRIYDDSLVTTEKRDMIYKDDCVEIFFDANSDGYYFDRNPNDYQLGIAPYGPGKVPQIWVWGYVHKAPDNISYTAKPTKDGYVMEVRIPFDAINGFGPKENKSIRFTISVHDRDADGKTKKLTWSIDSASQPGKILFGTLKLAD